VGRSAAEEVRRNEWVRLLAVEEELERGVVEGQQVEGALK
jgi:hypothetical protein